MQLATNAVSHTHVGDVIQFGSAFVDDDGRRLFRVWVRDTGPGVAPEDTSRIFERFRRGNPAPADVGGPAPERGGAGLGLAIVRAITDAHHGSVWVDSIPGEGATFGVDLPAHDPDLRLRATDHREQADPEPHDAESAPDSRKTVTS